MVLKFAENLSKLKNKILEIISNNFEITNSRNSKIFGAIVGALTLGLVLISVDEFTSQEFTAKWILLGFALFCPFILAFFTVYNIHIKSDKFNKIWHFIFLALMPIIAMTMTEALNGIFVYDMTYLGFLANYIIIIIMYFIPFAIFGSFRIAYLSITPILFIFALAHSYILQFRGTPFLPMDFLSIGTAAGVANTYDYTPTYNIVLAFMVFLFIMIIGAKTKTPKYNLPTKIVSRTFMVTFSSVILILYFGTSVFANLGVRPDFWNQSRGYKNYGFVFSFFSNTKYLYKSKPNDYNPENVGDYVDDVTEKEDKPVVDNSYKKPDIICIMNESLSDLSVLGELETNEDYMPFMRSLKENTIKGNLYVPVIGAGTSNTEFEFLTGHTTAFLPSGSNAYMLYVDEPIASLVSTVKAQGYSTYAMHPYFASGWKRTEVYKNFGFDLFDSIEDLFIPSIIQEYAKNGSDADYLEDLMRKQYPNDDVLLRQYVSDEYNYKQLIEDYECRDKSVPYFAFNVTMQNHGGYTTVSKNFEENIYATSVSQKYQKADSYLSLVKKSDEAFKELIAYFKKVKTPTVICMFGDHQPSIENEFIAEVMGVNNLLGLTPEQEQSRHCTQFYIWANFDIEEREIERLSANYLSSLVLETAGIKLTEYNKYLLELSKTLPVIDTMGYIDSEGVHYKWSDSSPYTDKIDNYEKVQYNNIFDQQNVDSNIFYIDDYVHSATEFE